MGKLATKPLTAGMVRFNGNVDGLSADAAVDEGGKHCANFDVKDVKTEYVEPVEGTGDAVAVVELHDGRKFYRRFSSEAEASARSWLALWCRKNLGR